jgi:hypothetical protein
MNTEYFVCDRLDLIITRNTRLESKAIKVQRVTEDEVGS